MCPILVLPPEILEKTVEGLTSSEILSACLSCRALMLAFGPRLWRQMVFNTPQTLLNFVEALDTDKARHIRIIELGPSVFPETSSVIMRDSQNSFRVYAVSSSLPRTQRSPTVFALLSKGIPVSTESSFSLSTPSSSPATEQLAPGNDWRPDGLEIVCPLSWLPTFQGAPVQKLRLEMPPVAQNFPIQRDLIPLHLVSLCLTGEWASMLTFLDCIAVFPPEEIIIYVNEDSTSEAQVRERLSLFSPMKGVIRFRYSSLNNGASIRSRTAGVDQELLNSLPFVFCEIFQDEFVRGKCGCLLQLSGNAYECPTHGGNAEVDFKDPVWCFRQ
ncbi:hypothetical protein R3P38DRAFT_2810693 [Favolaschia claudopus]|uniref:F-box domain-containing protein n=1 Tax=Favolaschia claudopus TaxID=2862362 RepID=A0AAV9ZAM0_9AGAR